MQNDKGVVAYQDLGIYKLLMDIENQDVINEYYAETIQRLVEYDKLNQTNYCDVLQCYLEHSGSVKETAEAMFVHRNTINYKINKIEEMLNCDLSELDTRLLYSIAFMLKKRLCDAINLHKMNKIYGKHKSLCAIAQKKVMLRDIENFWL